MSDNPRHPGKVYASEAIAAVDSALRHCRHAGAHAFDQLQFALFRLRVRLDPATREWVDAIDERLASGQEIEGSTSYDDFKLRAEEERLKARP